MEEVEEEVEEDEDEEEEEEGGAGSEMRLPCATTMGSASNISLNCRFGLLSSAPSF